MHIINSCLLILGPFVSFLDKFNQRTSTTNMKIIIPVAAKMFWKTLYFNIRVRIELVLNGTVKLCKKYKVKRRRVREKTIISYTIKCFKNDIE